MAENELVITLKLDDKASKEVADALRGIGKASDETSDKLKENNDKAEKGTTKHKDALIKARDAIKSFHQEMFIVTLAIGGATMAMNAYAERNNEARSTMDRLGLAVKNWAATIGSFLAPAVNKISKAIEDLNSGLIKGDLSDSFEKSKIAVKNFNDDVNKLSIEFQAGQIASEQYFNSILEKQNSVIAVNREAQTSISELAQLTSQIGNRELMEAQRRTSEQIGLLREYQANHNIAYSGIAAFTTTISSSIRTNLSSAISGIVTGATTAKEAFSQLGKAMINTVVEFMAQKVVAWVLEKTLLAGTVASSTVAGATVAAAWAPAAAMVSLATLGANAVPAAAGISSVNALTQGLVHVTSVMSGGGKELARSGFAGGSYSVPGFASGTDRSVAMVDAGEMIFPRTMADAIRSGEISVSGGGGSNAVGDISIYISGVTVNSKENIRSLAEELGFEIDRKLRNARSVV